MVGRRAHLVCVVSLLGLLYSPLCRAQSLAAGQRPGAADETEELLTSPRRIPERYVSRRLVPASTTVITAEEIQRSGASTIQDVLKRAVGVQFSDQQGFGLGSDSTLNLRGLVNSSRTNALVLVDGIRQNRVTGDDVHWQSIPVDQIARIEIIRGGGGTIYGEGALGGVINIMTKRDSDRPVEVENSEEIGSFGWQQYHAGVRGRAAPLRYGVDYTRRLVTGYRESSMSRNTTIGTHAGVDLSPELSADLHLHHSEDTTGFPGLLTKAQTQERRIQTNAFHGVNTNELDQVSLDLIAGPWEGWIGLMTMYWKRWVQTSEDSIDFNAFTITPSRGINLRSNQEWRGDHAENLLTNGVELFEDKATTGDRDAFAGPDSESNRFGYGLYAEDTLTLFDRVSLVGGVRFDKFRYAESLTFPAFEGTLRFQGWSPKLGLSVQVVPDHLNLFASYARPFKAPNVDDFSSRLGSSFNGNADLKPQQADAYDMGARWRHRLGEASATAFYTKINEEILFNQLASTNQNFDTRRFGIELASELHPTDSLRMSVAYTYVNAHFTEGQFVDSLVPGTPAHTLHTSLGVSPFRGLWMDLQWSIVSDYYRVNDFNNQLGKADNYGVLNLLCRYEVPRPARATALWPEATAYFKIENLTNEEYVTYQSSNGSNSNGAGEAPMPPTAFLGGVSVKF